MSTLLAEAGEYDAAANYTIGDVRRMSRLVDDVSRQVFELRQLSGRMDCDRIAYCLSILDRMGYRRVRGNSAEW